MSINDKWKFVNDNKLCPNCLRNNHTLENCRIGISCKNCAARHHTSLHSYATEIQRNEQVTNFTVSNTNTSFKYESNVLLSTALIKIKSNAGVFKTFRALIDNASQHSLISKQCVEALNLPTAKSTHKLVGINEIYAETSLYSTNFEFTPYFSSELFQVNALVVSKVTTPLPNFILKDHKWPHINNVILADPSFFVENEIDILLGADIFLNLVIGPPIMGPKGTPAALPTKIGYLLSGMVNTVQKQPNSIVCHTLLSIENNLKNFWELESIPQKASTTTDEDELCDSIFTNCHTRNSEGRYVVKLPFKENRPSLGDSKKGALQRFHSLERKLITDEELREKYIEFMREYINLGHMTLLASDLKSQNYFLPHHGVINENSTTTKLRVVFDGSFKSSSGNSLNDVLLKGRKLQSDIFNILTKFRTFPIAFSADITKMYRQILIANEDTPYQCIFWRESPNDPLGIYTLNTVTYGTVCAPYLAIKTIQQLCLDEQDKFPQASKMAQDHFYVDDLLAGAHSLDSAKFLIKQMLEFMTSGGFELRKWSCSHSEVISELPDNLKATTFSHSFEGNASQKILGLYWDLKLDSFQVRVVPADNVSTKRQLLSTIARTFDPLGFVAPAIIILKIMLQDVWKANLEWDDQLPLDILNRWNKFHAEIEYFKEIQIPRYTNSLHSSQFEVHGFCDSSIKAYAAVLYIRVLHSASASSQIFLVAAKTRVAPVQSMTLPKLELSGALLLAELLNKFKEAVKVPLQNIYLWTDSTITLGWINNPPIKGNQFVQHRVTKIHSLTKKNQWHHIPGKSNIADCASRGLYPKQLLENTEWFSGPNWLYEFEPAAIETDFPIRQSSDTIYDISSTSSLNTVSIPKSDNSEDPSEFLKRFSSYLKAIRTVAWIFRFYHNIKGDLKIKGPLQPSELNASIKAIVKSIQKTAFADDVKLIKSEKLLPKSSKLISLKPFFDHEGILRVGGRLRHHKDLNFNQTHPMLIPKHHHFTILLIRHYHRTNLHAGQELVLSLIRQSFWIPDGRSTVRKELRQCIDCCKIYAKPIFQVMGDLPPDRINPCRAFEKVAIDFAGPVLTKCHHSRKSTKFKSYLCIFICMCTKAVHLELVSSLSSTAFLATFRRFISRRGYPSDVYSDNGKNFVGAASYLKSLFQLPRDQSVLDYSSQRNIRWHFIPPYTPNFGGLWEAAVKLTKYHLLKSCKAAILNFEELATLLCQIEACINSRPLYPLSADPNDFQVLTPGHFLIGCPLVELPDYNSNVSSLSCHSRWTLIQQLKNQFWKHWSVAYLHTLQPRTKWMQKEKNLKVGQLILLKDSARHSISWSMGRIQAVHPGPDEITRVVTIRTPNGIIKRPVSQISILPVNESDDSMPPAAGCTNASNRTPN